MQRALSEFQIEGSGVKTTIPFHQAVLADERFRAGEVDTSFLEHFDIQPARGAGCNGLGGAVAQDSFDVAIMGGGLAGLTLALQLKRQRPDTSIFVAGEARRGRHRRPHSRSASPRSRSAPTTSRACAG